MESMLYKKSKNRLQMRPVNDIKRFAESKWMQTVQSKIRGAKVERSKPETEYKLGFRYINQLITGLGFIVLDFWDVRPSTKLTLSSRRIAKTSAQHCHEISRGIVFICPEKSTNAFCQINEYLFQNFLKLPLLKSNMSTNISRMNRIIEHMCL